LRSEVAFYYQGGYGEICPRDRNFNKKGVIGGIKDYEHYFLSSGIRKED
jgi:hypothetical protein